MTLHFGGDPNTWHNTAFLHGLGRKLSVGLPDSSRDIAVYAEVLLQGTKDGPI
jgi:hypothetical protein